MLSIINYNIASMSPKDQSTYKTFHLLHGLAFALDRQSDQVLQERLGIGFSQFKVMSVLLHCTNVQQRKIAEFLGQTEASVSRQIKLMVKNGLLSSTVRPDNRREHVTALTNRGHKLVKEAQKALVEFHKPTLNKIPAKQLQQFSDTLEQLHNFACLNQPNNR